MRTSWIAPFGLGLAVTIAGCSWFGGERNTTPGHMAPVTTDSQNGTVTPTHASAGTPANQRSASNMTKQQVRQAQQKLQQLGLYHGRIDGIYGPQTIAAVDKFQSENKLPRTGELSGATEQRLQSAQANRPQNRPQTAQQPAPNSQSNPQTSAVPANQAPSTGQNPNTNPSSNAPNNQPTH